jgi:hypothetical protein
MQDAETLERAGRIHAEETTDAHLRPRLCAFAFNVRQASLPADPNVLQSGRQRRLALRQSRSRLGERRSLQWLQLNQPKENLCAFRLK